MSVPGYLELIWRKRDLQEELKNSSGTKADSIKKEIEKINSRIPEAEYYYFGSTTDMSL